MFSAICHENLPHNKVHTPSRVIYLDLTLAFEWYMVRCGSKSNHEKACFKDVGLRALNTLTTLNSIVNIIGAQGTYSIWPINEHKNLPFDNK